jgi:hypothetical protein
MPNHTDVAVAKNFSAANHTMHDGETRADYYVFVDGPAALWFVLPHWHHRLSNLGCHRHPSQAVPAH